MKIYCLLLDALPRNASGLESSAKRNGLEFMHHVTTGMFTTATLLAMISGRLPSDLVPGGVGYLSHNEDRYFEWMKKQEGSRHLFDVLGKAGFDIRLHHHLDYLLRMLLGYRSEDPLAEFQSEGAGGTSRWPHVTLTSPEVYEADVGRGWLPRLEPFSEYGDAARREAFYESERRYIHNLQSEGTRNGRPLFFLTQQQDWHDCWYKRDMGGLAGARERTVAWLNMWDFAEPDSIFFVFSDHGYQVGSEITPKDTLAWALWRDNTRLSCSTPVPRLIASTDFYDTMVDIAMKSSSSSSSRGAGCTIASPDASPGTFSILGEKEHRNRIYIGEDARVKDSPMFACSAIVSIVNEWAENEVDKDCTVNGIAQQKNAIPMRMTTLSYIQGNDQGEKPTRLSAYRYHFFHENPYAFEPVHEPSFAGTPLYVRLRGALASSFSWIDAKRLSRAIDGFERGHGGELEGGGRGGGRGKEGTEGEKRDVGMAAFGGLLLLPDGRVVPSLPPGTASL